MGINHRDCLDALLKNSTVEDQDYYSKKCTYILGSLDALLQYIVHEFACIWVIVTESLKHFQAVDLQPRGWHSVVIILNRILVVQDLLKNIHNFLSFFFVGNSITKDELLKYRHAREYTRHFCIA